VESNKGQRFVEKLKVNVLPRPGRTASPGAHQPLLKHPLGELLFSSQSWCWDTSYRHTFWAEQNHSANSAQSPHFPSPNPTPSYVWAPGL